MANIALFELEPWEKEYVKKKLKGHTLKFFEGHLDDKTVSKVKNCEAIATFIYSDITKKLLDQLPKVKLITTMSTGFDHIDLKACKAKKITACNVPEYGSDTVAEHTVALMLTVSKKIVESVERTRRGKFSQEGLRGFDLKGKTLGVVGTGKIGRNVAHIAKEGFGMKVIAYDLYPNAQRAKQCGFTYVSYDKLLKESDIISFHVPLTKETTHLFNKKSLTKVKKGVVIINTARGKVIDTKALLEGLQKGIIKAAGLDVLEEECMIQEEKQVLTERYKKECDVRLILDEHILLAQDNVYITPHNAFNSQEALERIIDTTIENIKAFLKKKPINVVSA